MGPKYRSRNNSEEDNDALAQKIVDKLLNKIFSWKELKKWLMPQ